MFKKIALVAVLAAVLAAPAFAEVQNIKLSGSLNMIGLARNNFDFGNQTALDDQQSIAGTQTELHVNADLTDQVSATVGILNERAWGVETSSNTDMDLYLAYVTLREFLYSPLTIVAGKQAFKYGNSLVVDSSGPNTSAPSSSGWSDAAEDLTAQSTMDAVRAILDYNPVVVELLWAKISENDIASGGNVDDDADLYGVNATYNVGDDKNTQVEGYFFANIAQDSGDVTPSGGGVVDNKIYVPGIRVSSNVVEGLNLQGELAYQFGNNTSDYDRSAWAAQFIGTYAIPEGSIGMEGMHPTVQYVFTYVSGDGDVTDNDVDSWDPLYENQAGGTIYNSLFNLTNSQIHALSFSATPVEDVLAKITWTGLWLDEKLPTTSALSTGAGTFNQPDGSSVTLANSTDDSNLGHEVDVDVSYAYTEDVKVGASLGWFFPGDVFTSANNDTASQALVNAKVTF